MHSNRTDIHGQPRYDASTPVDASLPEVVHELVKSMRDERLTRLRSPEGSAPGTHTMAPVGAAALAPSAPDCFRASDLARVREMMDLIRRLMFPGYFDPDPAPDRDLEPHVSRLIGRVSSILHEEVGAVMRYRKRSVAGAQGVETDGAFVSHAVREFLASLVRVRELLGLDVQAAYDGDPAAEHTDEVVLCYPGLDAIYSHRVAHELYRLGVPILPRVISEQAHSRTGIDVHPGAQIGESFFIDHGSATVIGETSVIGRLVKIYQGVTLGARSFPKDERGRAIKGLKRHPTIGDRVTIYAGAVILGGDTVIGDDCVIAGGVFVTSSVPPGHVVQQTRPDLVLRPAPGAAVQAKSGGARPDADAGRRVNVGWLGDGAGI